MAELHAVAREVLHKLPALLDRDGRDAGEVTRPHLLFHEGARSLPRADQSRRARVGEIEHQEPVPARRGGRLLEKRIDPLGCRRAQVRDLEAGDLLLFSVVVELEVSRRQARERLAVLPKDVDGHLDDGDGRLLLDGVRTALLRGRRTAYERENERERHPITGGSLVHETTRPGLLFMTISVSIAPIARSLN